MTHITNWSLFQTPKCTTLEPRSLFCGGKIIIYVNSDLHKLHLQVKKYLSFWFVVNVIFSLKHKHLTQFVFHQVSLSTFILLSKIYHEITD